MFCKQMILYSNAGCAPFETIFLESPNFMPTLLVGFWTVIAILCLLLNFEPSLPFFVCCLILKHNHLYGASHKHGSPPLDKSSLVISCIMLPFDIFIPPLVFKSCKALLKYTPSIRKMYKGIYFLSTREKLQGVKLVQSSQNLSMFRTNHLG